MKTVSKKWALLLAALAITAIPASASAQVFTPDEEDFSAVASGNTVLTKGTSSITCVNSDAGGTTGTNSAVATLDNPRPTFDGGCTVLVSGTDVDTATVTTSGSWTITASGATSATITVPNGGAVIHLNANDCTLTLDPSDVTGTWTNGSGGSNSNLTFNNATGITVVGSGGACTSGAADYTGTYNVTAATATESIIITS